jgi:hypothetical protein
MKDPKCEECGKTDYHENPGPWFLYPPNHGWFCSAECWLIMVRRKHGITEADLK